MLFISQFATVAEADSGRGNGLEPIMELIMRLVFRCHAKPWMSVNRNTSFLNGF